MKLFIGIAVIIFGVILVVIGGASYAIIKNNVVPQIEEADRMDSQSSLRLPVLLQNEPIYGAKLSWTLFNYTNLDGFLHNSEKPMVEACGPYVYRHWSDRVGEITFTDNSNVFSWIGNFRYDFLAEESSDINSTILTPLRSYFQGVTVMGGRNEKDVLFGAGAYVTFDTIMYTIDSVYEPGNWLEAALYMEGKRLVESKISELGMDEFVGRFLNRTLSEPSLTLGASVFLTLEQGKVLFTSSNNNSILYFEEEFELNENLKWYQASLTELDAIQLRETFVTSLNFSEADFETIFAWRKNILGDYLKNYLISTYGIDWTDLDIISLQMAKGFLDPLRINGVTFGWYPIDLEIPLFNGSSIISFNETRYMILQWNWYTDLDRRVNEMSALYDGTGSKPDWVLNDEHFEVLKPWFRHLMDITISAFMNPDLFDKLTPYGMIMGRPADDWAVSSNMFGRNLAGINVLSGLSYDYLKENNFTYVLRTGADDIMKKKEVVLLRGDQSAGWSINNNPFGGYYSSVPDLPPFPDRSPKQYWFVWCLNRQIEATYLDNGKYEGINYDRYSMDIIQKSLNPENPEYYNLATGMWAIYDTFGQDGGAIIYGTPFFQGTSPSVSSFWSDQLNADPTDIPFWIDIDPLTGIAIRYQYSLQYNYEMTPHYFSYSFQNISKPNFFLPWALGRYSYEATPDDKSNIKTWQSRYHLRIVIPAVGCTVGAVFITVGVIIVVLSLLKRGE